MEKLSKYVRLGPRATRFLSSVQPRDLRVLSRSLRFRSHPYHTVHVHRSLRSQVSTKRNQLSPIARSSDRPLSFWSQLACCLHTICASRTSGSSPLFPADLRSLNPPSETQHPSVDSQLFLIHTPTVITACFHYLWWAFPFHCPSIKQSDLDPSTASVMAATTGAPFLSRLIYVTQHC